MSVFPGSVIGQRCELRINSVVHLNSELEPDTVVPIGWIAAGGPARCHPMAVAPAAVRAGPETVRAQPVTVEGRAAAAPVGWAAAAAPVQASTQPAPFGWFRSAYPYRPPCAVRRRM
ncbi:hypothetical protein GCM10011492_12090 [Flexivirga endophytica]|uniref:Uncharacterized protein n=1 Tax=Flexivirga endophytica TaxID=1849103 RepID=A0A916SYV9_9MICO|nr:hypothetical protein GCM10011492_12090 [Flexivirga endophytica]GHB57736.1 hypothetical protein GCM10008112_28630 [Flexivirga endophytica]